MVSIAFCPSWRETSGSWQWIGVDLAEWLRAQGHDVSTILDSKEQGREESRRQLRECGAEIVVVVKTRKVLHAALRFKKKRQKIVYMPIDKWHAPKEIGLDGWHLKRCNLICCHSELLRSRLAEHGFRNTAVIDHHLKFASRAPRTWRPWPLVFWCGVKTNWPAFAEWFSEHRPTWANRCLISPLVSREAFGADAALEQWTPESHSLAVATCTHAIDVKANVFWDKYKPPTKAVEAVASGLPLALNAGHCGRDRLRRLGLDPPVPEDEARWFSRAYWDQTQAAREQVWRECSLDAIGGRFIDLLQSIR